jgi:polyisoprenoid-binding protein YceI
LTIKGRTQTITVTISVQRAVGAASFDGSFDMSRSAFGIGDPIWNDVLDDQVRVRFHLLKPGP